jgi:hypothetical protein
VEAVLHHSLDEFHHRRILPASTSQKIISPDFLLHSTLFFPCAQLWVAASMETEESEAIGAQGFSLPVPDASTLDFDLDQFNDLGWEDLVSFDEFESMSGR